MRRLLGVEVAVVSAFVAAPVALADVTDSRSLEETLRIAPGEAVVVIVDNVFGRVAVTGYDGDDIEMRATQTVRGDLRADIERARAEIELKVGQEPGRVAFRVRNKDGPGCDCGWQRWNDYVVVYDIELKVPRRASLELSTVNEGDVVVAGVQGDLDLHNVNGNVEVEGARGAGRISTVNGAITARFERSPERDSAFKTVNGRIDIALPADLAASLEFQSMHGEIATDFELTPVGSVSPSPESGRGLRRMSKPVSSRFRVGAGGPVYSFNTLNGDIYVRKVSK